MKRIRQRKKHNTFSSQFFHLFDCFQYQMKNNNNNNNNIIYNKIVIILNLGYTMAWCGEAMPKIRRFFKVFRGNGSQICFFFNFHKIKLCYLFSHFHFSSKYTMFPTYSSFHVRKRSHPFVPYVLLGCAWWWWTFNEMNLNAKFIFITNCWN